MAAKTADWGQFLNLTEAVANTETDIIGDWYSDPWGWPENAWLATTTGMPHLIQRLNSSGVRRSARIDVAKENFGTRPALVMDPIDRVIYQALVDYYSVTLAEGTAGFVCGWRLARESPTRGKWLNNGNEHERYRDILSSLADRYNCALKTDVVSCFASIPMELLIDVIEERIGTGQATARLIDLIQGWSRIPDRSGLIQRSGASAALANFFLSPGDEVLQRFGKARGTFATAQFPYGTALRWMDDVWLFSNNLGRLREAQVAYQDVLRSRGLELNHAKTRVFQGAEMVHEAKAVKHSAVEAHLMGLGDGPDDDLLEQLICELLAEPEQASRTEIAFVTKRMRDHELFDHVDSFLDAANRMPQGAEYLAKLFRKSGKWEACVDWFIGYRKSPWGVIDSSVAQIARMFPSDWSPVPEALFRSLYEAMQGSTASLPIVATAAHRLAAWRPKDPETMALLREAAKQTSHPLTRRALVLAALQAGEPRASVQSLLTEFEENAVTLAMLKEKKFKIKTDPNFA